VGKVLKSLAGQLDGIALRVPTPVVSITDFVCVLKKEATVEEINAAMKDAAGNGMKNILAVTEEPVVSMDLKGNKFSVIIDLPLTMANGNLVKVVGWYDNEWGYSNRLVEMAEFVAK
jgi:glyceraldehyde 3-phosphate dehydrogenase